MEENIEQTQHLDIRLHICISHMASILFTWESQLCSDYKNHIWFCTCTYKSEYAVGTRHGCPLSPLLFILTLEVLNRNVRNGPEIKGTKIKNENCKLQAFADDLVFILEDSLETTLRQLDKIDEFR